MPQMTLDCESRRKVPRNGDRAKRRQAATLQYSKTPSLRSPGIEDEDSLPDEAFALSAATSVRERSRDDEDENEAPHEGLSTETEPVLVQIRSR